MGIEGYFYLVPQNSPCPTFKNGGKRAYFLFVG